MSTLVHRPKYEVLDVQQIGEAESILAQIVAGVLSAGEEAQAYLADEDEAEDMAGVRGSIKRLNFNANHGKFAPAEIVDEEVKRGEYPAEIEGILLARLEGQVFYGFNPEYRERMVNFKSKGFKSLLDVKTWICGNRNTLKGLPEVNPALTPEQLEEAKKFGIGGACGTTCKSCPMNVWYKDELGANARDCQGTEAYLWLGLTEQEPVVLQTSSSQSFTAIKRFLDENCTVITAKGRQPAKIYRFVVRIRTKIGAMSKMVMAPEVVGLVPPSALQFLGEYRQYAKSLLERADIAGPEEPTSQPSESQAQEAALGGIL